MLMMIKGTNINRDVNSDTDENICNDNNRGEKKKYDNTLSC